MDKWYHLAAPENDVVVSTRVCLARSLPDCAYPQRMNALGRLQVEKRVCTAAMTENSSIGHCFSYLRMEELEKSECLSFWERGLISSAFAEERVGGLLLTQDESVSITVNDEDHLRIRVLHSGLSLKDVYEDVDQLDTILDKNLHFAFDPELGYLTQNPANVGTGMRASLLLHLSALQASGSIGRIATGLAKLGLSLEEEHGMEEPDGVDGVLLRLSNHVTLGLSEQQALHNLEEIASQLIAQERTARASFAQKLSAQDMVSRAIGLLQNARMLSSAEMIKLLCCVRFGVAVGLAPKIPYEVLDTMMVDLLPETLMLTYGKSLSKTERDSRRADLVRIELFQNN